MEGTPKKAEKHICLTNRRPLGISSDPESEIIAALADADVLTMVRGLSKEEISAPFTDGAFGMDEKRVNDAVRKMKEAGLICSHKKDDRHFYYLNRSRIRFLADSLNELAREPAESSE